MEDKQIFKAWMAELDFDTRGGIAKAAKALGKDRRTIERYIEGASLSKETRLAMTAIAQNLSPWDPQTEGLPAVHFSLSIGGKQKKA
ncbi:hypothetical protein DES40_1706 [Litorimonas taeanensis]|uniref:Uncharacterized protein n=1 Tax=Litorimonas taeanensis TaxID=568099 RepID=A0A420WDD1_9PROT|nr:hypothetical protein [Litorimonas taeanensis]RKQ68930.1 hypothetical protein DES40_1706 [Litorimonas taeanensis]